jgi:hypothetical protein
MSDRPKIVLDESDFADLAGGETPSPGPAAAAVPAAAPVPPLPPPLPGARGSLRIDPREHAGMPGQAKLSGSLSQQWLNAPGRSMLLAAGTGVLAAWALTEILGLAELSAGSKTAADAQVGLWTGVVGAVFGGTLLSFEAAVLGAYEVAAKQLAKAVVPMFLAAFVAGFAANAVYLQIIEKVVEASLRGEEIVGANDIRFYLARALGWALFGIGVGATVGLLKRSNRQAVNGAIGGAIGGTAGGIAFQFLTANLQAGNSLSRLLGLAAVGALIALATRAVETARREAWLQVIAGGMAGKEFIIYHDLTRLGSSPECEIFLLKDPGVANLHATIEDRGTRRILTAIAGARMLVNDEPVASHALAHGDRLQLGSTLIAYSERTPAAVAGAG